MLQICRHASNNDNVNECTTYDKHGKVLNPIAAGDAVCLWLPGHTALSTGRRNGLVDLRSYDIQVGERIYRCNQHQLIEVIEPPVPDPTVVHLPLSDQVSPGIEQTASQQ